MVMRQDHQQVPQFSAAAARIVREVEEEPRLEALEQCILDRLLTAFGAAAVALYAFEAGHRRLDLLKQRGFAAPFEHDRDHLALDEQAIVSKAASSGELQIPEPTHAATRKTIAAGQAVYDRFPCLVAVPLSGALTDVGARPDEAIVAASNNGHGIRPASCVSSSPCTAREPRHKGRNRGLASAYMLPVAWSRRTAAGSGRAVIWAMEQRSVVPASEYQ